MKQIASHGGCAGEHERPGLVLEALANIRNAFAQRMKSLTSTLDGGYASLPGNGRAQVMNLLLYLNSNHPDRFTPDDKLVFSARSLLAVVWELATRNPFLSGRLLAIGTGRWPLRLMGARVLLASSQRLCS